LSNVANVFLPDVHKAPTLGVPVGFFTKMFDTNKLLHQIRNYVSRETMIELAMSFVISCVDYCNPS